MNSYSILIVEDEIDIARAIEAYLNNQGYFMRTYTIKVE